MHTRRLFLVAGLGLLSAGGCVTQTIDDRPKGPWTVQAQQGGGRMGGAPAQGPVVQGAVRPGPTPRSVLESTDTAEGRLHDISGLLLQYYLAHQAYPARLEDALAMDPMVSGICPASNQPFAYVPPVEGGGWMERRVAVYQPVANSKGSRWAVLVRPKMGQTAPAAWVVELSEIQLQGYLRTPLEAPETRPTAAGS